jgi:fructose-bisphosphate aldolase class 1
MENNQSTTNQSLSNEVTNEMLLQKLEAIEQRLTEMEKHLVKPLIDGTE